MTTLMFHSAHHDALPHPVPASKALPAYFRPIPRQRTSDPETGTVKRCVPFLDAMTEGVILPLWCDVHVLAQGDDLTFKSPQAWPLGEIIAQHDYAQAPNHPLAANQFGKIFLKWLNPWIISTEPGYSALFTAPMNHLEPRFKILDGIVDTDTYYNEVNFPFLWTGGEGEFLIPAGTPLVQIVPLKREGFHMHIGAPDQKRHQDTRTKLGTKMRDSYRSQFWHRRKEDGDDL